ncbi:MAG: rRNA maturation RNase YbeY [Acidiferrobacterales bacterium]
MKLRVHVDYVSSVPDLPGKATITEWTRAALEGDAREQIEIGVRVVDEAEIANLNKRFRGKSGPTNVLAFSFENTPAIATDFLGDIVICAPIVQREAQEQGKPELAHWAHMVVHAIMHLRGHDHNAPEEAQAMESIEGCVLTKLGFADPYAAT